MVEQAYGYGGGFTPVLLLRSVFAVLRGFSAGVCSWVSFLVKSDIGGILGVWRWYILQCLFYGVCLCQI